ncbi:hypothetical protein RJT34_16890 [Clitoria ternatea]|uniref:Uncharacterized protein n=1 Tax=Clitoria ternatea TaxID=43366 RepID=A0AAN9J880_CLITE
MTDLKIAVETAGDMNQTGAQIDLVRSVFKVVPPSVPMLSFINLANDGFLCCKSTTQAFFGVVLRGSGVCGKKLAEMALMKVRAGVLTHRLVETAHVLIMATTIGA